MKNQTLIIDIKDHNGNAIFKDLLLDYNDKSEMKLLSSVNTKKWQVIDGVYLNAKIYIAKISLDVINKLLRNNITLDKSDDYIDVYLIYN